MYFISYVYCHLDLLNVGRVAGKDIKSNHGVLTVGQGSNAGLFFGNFSCNSCTAPCEITA